MDERSRYSDLARPPLRERALAAALTPDPWRRIEVVAQTGSTNADVVARARAGEAEGLVLVADHQASGRGRLDRSWTAPPRSSLAVSVLLRPAGVPGDRLAWLPLLAGLAVVDALTVRCGLATRLKWPNDVLVPVHEGAESGAGGRAAQERKVCGVLAELVPDLASGPSSNPAVVVGAGINVSQQRQELPVPTATSLLLAGAATTDRDTVLRAYLRALATRYRAWAQAAGDPRVSGVGPAYREACSTLGQTVRVQVPSLGEGAPALQGVAEEVDDEGRLVVRGDDAALHVLAAGDVIHVRRASA